VNFFAHVSRDVIRSLLHVSEFYWISLCANAIRQSEANSFFFSFFFFFRSECRVTRFTTYREYVSSCRRQTRPVTRPSCFRSRKSIGRFKVLHLKCVSLWHESLYLRQTRRARACCLRRRLLLTEAYHMTKTASYKAKCIFSNVISGNIIWQNVKTFMAGTNLKYFRKGTRKAVNRDIFPAWFHIKIY